MILSTQAGIAMQNAELHNATLVSQQKVQGILDVVEAMHSNLGVVSGLLQHDYSHSSRSKHLYTPRTTSFQCCPNHVQTRPL